MAKTHTDPVCGAVYSDWADDPAWGDDYLARICSLEPAHDGHHGGPAASPAEIQQVARRYTQDSS